MDDGAAGSQGRTGKKLTAAGYAWAVALSKPAGRDGLAEDSLHANIPAEYFQSEKPTDFVVEDDNWRAFALFLDCATQWRYLDSMKIVRVGLDYSALAAVLSIRRVRNRDRLFDQIRLLERGALLGFAGVPLEDVS